jgi:hypothetical protein
VINDSTARRRWFGALCLLAAVILLVADEYLIKGRLGNWGKLAYWFVCFAFTMLAILAAFLDLRALRRSTRDEQRTLFEDTLRNIPDERKGKAGDSE